MGSSDSSKGVATQTSETECKQQACCSSPSALCYWCTVSLAVWGFLSLLGIFWRPLRAAPDATCLFAGAIGCFANWLKNRTFHCGITSWLFLAGAVLLLLSEIGLIQFEPRFVWLAVAIGTVFSFVLEWRYASRTAR